MTKPQLDITNESQVVSPFPAGVQKAHINRRAQQGWAENSTPSISRWNFPVFPGMANKAQVANNGKYNFFAAKYWQL